MSQLSHSHYGANKEAALPVRRRRKVRVTGDEGYGSAGGLYSPKRSFSVMRLTLLSSIDCAESGEVWTLRCLTYIFIYLA
jgi:hypothetical protein